DPNSRKSEPPHLLTVGRFFYYFRRSRSFRRVRVHVKLARGFWGGAFGEHRVLVRVREHLFLSGGAQGRRARGRSRRARRRAPVPARADLRRARLARFAVQHLSGQGPLHVARPRADVRGDGGYVQAPRSLSPAEPARRASRSRFREISGPISRGGSSPPNSATA